jgi:glycerate kinase
MKRCGGESGFISQIESALICTILMARLRILIVPDKFKGTLSAQEVANALAKGVCKAVPSVSTIKIPLADGGDGTGAILSQSLQAKKSKLVSELRNQLLT